jgi:hypothetical protein
VTRFMGHCLDHLHRVAIDRLIGGLYAMST